MPMPRRRPGPCWMRWPQRRCLRAWRPSWRPSGHEKGEAIRLPSHRVPATNQSRNRASIWAGPTGRIRVGFNALMA
ncbi:hypothetical protein CVM50_17455 [Pseudooceanicola marinus]|nr:hypothetical protein CVM50_17455 [Pseudooceanicola marinus]